MVVYYLEEMSRRASSPESIRIENIMKKTLVSILVILTAVLAANAQKAENTDVADASAAALRVYRVLQTQDWAGLFEVISFSPAVQRQMPTDANDFADQFESGLNANAEDAATTKKMFDGMSEIQVGTAIVNGKKAKVPTSCRITIDNKSLIFNGTAHMIKVGKAWRWDMTSSDDPAVATETALSALLGIPIT